MVYSFDIFETLISRKTATTEGIYLLVRKAAKDHSFDTLDPAFIDDFHAIREESHRKANLLSGGREITLDAIYGAMSQLHPDLSERDLDKLKSLEIETEIDHAYGIQENIDRVLRHLEQSERVILISDMYLDRSAIQSMLQKVEPRLIEIPLYLSSEIGLRKADGDLFQHVIEKEQIAAAELTHTGDHPEIDINQAKRLGINTVHYTAAHPNGFERSCLLDSGNLFFQLCLGASRQARLSKVPGSPEYDLGASFTAPLFFGFVHDAILAALARGETKIHFLARDGYLLKRVADIIISRCGYSMETRYVFVSRKSLYPAGLFNLNRNELGWLFEEMDNQRSAALVADRLDLNGPERELLLNREMRQLTGVEDCGSRLSDRQTDLLLSYIQESKDLRQAILRKSREKRELLIEYFSDEGMLDGKALTFVDIGWRGTLQDAIFRVLKEARPDISIIEHYFGVSRYSSLTSEKNQKTAYIMHASSRPTVAPVLEHILQADHGTTVGHQRDKDGVVRPILKEMALEQCAWKMSDYSDGVEAFTAIFCEHLNSAPMVVHFKAVANLLLERADEGDRQLAETLGDLAYCGSQEEDNRRKIAPPLTPVQALKYILSSSNQKKEYTQWRQGSYLRSNLLAKTILKFDPAPLTKRTLQVFLDPAEIRQIPHFVRKLMRSVKGKLPIRR